ncbi:MAG: hypothetical protein R2713_01745 [Ilumatobacteraceae bacterium]
MTAGRALTRRALLAAASATTGGLLLAGHVAADDMVVTYALDPTIGGTCLAPSCSTCNACQAHGANKLFASAAAAEAGRAHPNCLCTVVPGISVPKPCSTNSSWRVPALTGAHPPCSRCSRRPSRRCRRPASAVGSPAVCSSAASPRSPGWRIDARACRRARPRPADPCHIEHPSGVVAGPEELAR